MSGKLKWEGANRHEKAAFKGIALKPIPTDADFWRLWKTDRETMRRAGVKLRKVGNRWQAWVEIQT